LKDSTRFNLLFVGFVALAAVVYVVSRNSVEPAPNNYFRMVTSVEVDGRERLDIDLVVECQCDPVKPLGGSTSYRAVRVPFIYGVKTKAGHAVLVLTPLACGIAEKMPSDFLPLLLWTDNADDLEFLTAYTSEAGDEHSSSRLKLLSVRFSAATAEDHLAWTKTAPKNVVTDGDIFRPHGGKGSYRQIAVSAGQDGSVGRYGSIGCSGMWRLPIPETDRARVRALWPENRPEFWAPRGWFPNGLSAIQAHVQASPAAAFRHNVYHGGPILGLLRKNGSGIAEQTKSLDGALPLDTYPIDAGFSYVHKREGQFRTTRENVRVNIGSEAVRGQMYCTRWPVDEASIKQANGGHEFVTYEVDLGGRVLESKTGPEESGGGLNVIERDQYWLQPIGIGLSSETGRLR
jgi:hypothetical protein